MGAVASTTGCCQSEPDDTDDEDEDGGREVASFGLHSENIPSLRRCITVFSGTREAPFAPEYECTVEVGVIVLILL